MYTVIVADDEEELRHALIRRVDWESIVFFGGRRGRIWCRGIRIGGKV